MEQHKTYSRCCIFRGDLPYTTRMLSKHRSLLLHGLARALSYATLFLSELVSRFPIASGSVKKNVVPTPGLLSAQTFPPCCTTIAFTTANPTPEPRCAVGFACQNRSKIFEISVSLMPGPVSLIANRTWLSICTEPRVTRPPSGVNLIALSNKLERTCKTRLPVRANA